MTGHEVTPAAPAAPDISGDAAPTMRAGRASRAWRGFVAVLWRLNGVRPPDPVHRSDLDQLMRSMHG